MAPELVDSKSYNNKADLWSLGTITYQLLFGINPFNGRENDEVYKNIRNGVYNLPKKLQVSKEILTFLNGLLQFNPEKRLDWDDIVRHPFIVRKPSEFHYLNLQQIEDLPSVDTKKMDNFLWVMYEELLSTNKKELEDKIELDKITTEKIQSLSFTENIESKNNKNNDSINKISNTII